MPFWRKTEDRDRPSGERPEDWERGDPFDDPFFDMRSDLFRDFDDQFRRMRSYMDAMMEKAASGELKDTGEGGPFVYGWSMRVGPDGVPHVQTFGNVKPQAMRGGKPMPLGLEGARREAQGAGGEGARAVAQGAGDDYGTGEACPPGAMGVPGVREPLTDICEGEKEITITAEMPGIEKDQIELETGDDFLVIKVEKGNRKYFKELPLDVKIAPGSARAKYNNGVLEITMAKAPAEKKGTKVKVE
jgi:HSP20 family protein